MKKYLAAAAGLTALLLSLSPAMAAVDVNINLPGAPAPVFVQPRPVYIQPQPVYVEPRPVYIPAQRVYVDPDDRNWKCNKNKCKQKKFKKEKHHKHDDD